MPVQTVLQLLAGSSVVGVTKHRCRAHCRPPEQLHVLPSGSMLVVLLLFEGSGGSCICCRYRRKGVRYTYCLVAASDSRRRCWQPPLRSGCCQQLEWQHLQTTLGGQYVAAAFEVCRSTVQPASFAAFDHTAVTYVVRTTCVLLGVRSSLLASLWLLPAHCVLTARAAVLCAEAEVACQTARNKG